MRGSGSLGLRFTLLAIVCLSLMLLDHQQGHMTRVRQGLAYLVYPIQLVVDFARER